jgi:BioD-like phosphotransacetylase family protein
MERHVINRQDSVIALLDGVALIVLSVFALKTNTAQTVTRLVNVRPQTPSFAILMMVNANANQAGAVPLATVLARS